MTGHCLMCGETGCNGCDIVERLRATPETGADHDMIFEAADEIERLRKVADAARCIRHWHDRANGGMVVSGEHVMALWQALHELDVSPNAS